MKFAFSLWKILSMSWIFIKSKMIIFESLLATFEASIIFVIPGEVAKIGYSLNQTTVTKFNKLSLTKSRLISKFFNETLWSCHVQFWLFTDQKTRDNNVINLGIFFQSNLSRPVFLNLFLVHGTHLGLKHLAAPLHW